jgi:hypothetical protein
LAYKELYKKVDGNKKLSKNAKNPFKIFKFHIWFYWSQLHLELCPRPITHSVSEGKI